MAQKVVFITTTGAGTYTIPSDFVSLISVEAIGGGGASQGSTGGGGGAYAKSTVVTGLVAGGTAYYQVGQGSISTSPSNGVLTYTQNSTDSWFNASLNSAPTLTSQGVLAKAGADGLTGTGGSASSCVGEFKYSGGNGGITYHGGGGGAAGPGGAGGNGGDGNSGLNACGGGGGGASISAAGSNGSNGSVSNVGGNGGNGGVGSGGGAGGSNAAGTAGTAGTGGGGGGQGGGTASTGGNGATGNYWTATAGGTAGSGGGGGGSGGGTGAVAGSGGLYGGGGASSGSGPGSNTVMSVGAQGIIVFTYETGTKKTVFITTTGASTFTIPSDFGSLAAIEAIGGGAGGDKPTGGGGGAYAKSFSVTGLNPGQTCYVSVGTGGASSTSGADSWFNATSNAAPTLASQGVLAKAGAKSGGSSTTGGAGGAAASCVGDIKYSGGAGGDRTSAKQSGGGGAAGPGGAGGKGGDENTGNSGGGGGGGASLTGAGYVGGASVSASLAGAGGNGGNNTGGGSAGTGVGVSGGNGTAGTGGGGGGITDTGTSSASAGNGATGNYWTQTSNSATAGSGGGGGGTGNGGGAVGGSGGLYGGGGGACVNTSQSGTGGQGIVVFSYYVNTNLPSSGTNVYGRQNTGFKVFDGLSQTTQDLGERYVSKDYLLDVYPNIASATGNRTAPGLWGWGLNYAGTGSAIGNGSTAGVSTPVQVGNLTNWKQVSTCNNTVSAAVKTDGTLWMWGVGAGGVLGNGTITDRSSPVQAGTISTYKQVSVGCNNAAAAAIRTDGTLWTWGNNGNAFQLGIGTTLSASTPVQVGTLTNWKQVITESDANCMFAIKTDGTLWAWGSNTDGRLGVGVTTPTAYSTPVQVGTLTNWKQLGGAAGVKTDGTLWAWGINTFGQIGDGTTIAASSPVQIGTLNNWKSIIKATGISFGIKTDGTLWAWGSNTGNYLGALGDGTTISKSSPIQIGSLTNWKQVTASNVQTSDLSGCVVQAIKTDGTMWGWGNLPGIIGKQGRGGSIGNGSANLTSGENNVYILAYSSPIQIGSLTSWKSVATGGIATLAIQDGYI